MVLLIWDVKLGKSLGNYTFLKTKGINFGGCLTTSKQTQTNNNVLCISARLNLGQFQSKEPIKLSNRSSPSTLAFGLLSVFYIEISPL
jgi:hypothetical protein